jgi:hypothetical protein
VLAGLSGVVNDRRDTPPVRRIAEADFPRLERLLASAGWGRGVAADVPAIAG